MKKAAELRSAYLANVAAEEKSLTAEAQAVPATDMPRHNVGRP